MKYTLKEILEGYKLEYLKIKEQLDKILNNIKILDNNLEKCLPFISNNKELFLYFIDSKKHIIDATILIKEKYQELIYKLNNLSYDENIKNVIHIENKDKGYHILIPYIEEFKKDLLTLLTSDYLRLMQLNIIDINDNELSINYDKISFSKDNGLTELIYYFKPDLIKSNSNNVEELLNTKFSSIYFTPYQQDIIESANKKKTLQNY